MISLVYRHNRITRLTHWVNALSLVILFMSGLQIFNAYPNLHWGSKAEPDEAFFSIYAANDEGAIRGYTQIFGLRAETTGFLGVQQTEMGPFPRAFPSWLTIPGFFWLAGGRRWHFFFAWVFVANGVLYFFFNLANGHLRKFLLTPRDARELFPMILYYLRLRRESPQLGEYNPLQKAAYTGIFLLLTPLIIFSGMAMSPQLDVAFNSLPAAFGGRQSARSIHFVLTFLFALFTFGHIFMVITTGAVNNMRSIITGWYREKTAVPPEIPKAAPEEATNPSSVQAEATSENAGTETAQAETPRRESLEPMTPPNDAPVQTSRAETAEESGKDGEK
ncbi:MAG: cytochrome b/b6 domain-containing protein [Deltaproteobacteria bacterium]|nr:cytochrome b/b6 domain-containing protein [Deltaproteobacteria bacterium]